MSDNELTEDDSIVEEEVEDAVEEITIEKVIDNFLHRILDIEDCAREYVSLAIEKYNKNAERISDELSGNQELLKHEDHDQMLLGVKSLRKSLREMERHNNSSPVDTLEKSLFINLFAAFDKYIGDLVSLLYQLNPDLYKNINKEVSLSEALKFDSMDELKNMFLEKEIETLRRKSYIEQFISLEGKFSLKLTKFESWPKFIEMSQRRNLFTHCDGVVSKQYIDACTSSGYKFKEAPLVGDQLRIGSEYFFSACQIMTEVGVMLGQTLWRKTFPKSIKEADTHLNTLVFDFLHIEHWDNAISLSKFSLDLPRISTDEMERLFAVNYAIALKAINRKNSAMRILNKKDWSASTYDFKIAYAVLDENYLEAKKLMERIGKTGELISELAYHEWPLFRDFRDRDEFFEGYLNVYGYKYASKLSLLVDETKSEIEETSNENQEINS